MSKESLQKFVTANAIVVTIAATILGFALVAALGKIKVLTSERNELKQAQSVFTKDGSVFAYEGRSYVAYDEAPIDAVIYTSSKCTNCAEDIEAITAKVRASLPTLRNVIMRDTDDTEIQMEALEQNIAFVPSMILSKEVEQTQLFETANDFFAQTKNGSYQLFVQSLGHTPRKYIASPKGKKGMITPAETTTINVANPTKEIHAFLTADCPSCKNAYDVLGVIDKANQNVEITYHLSNAMQEQVSQATTSVACVDHIDPTKTKAYTDNLYARQAAWLAVTTDLEPVFTRYAGFYAIAAADFTECLQSPPEAVVASIQKQEKAFNTFGISQVPTIFVEDQVFTGVQTTKTISDALK